MTDWDETLERLLAEARREQSPLVEVPLPASLSATSLTRLREDPDTFASELARPMPRRPAPSARLGTRFHEWVESRLGQPDLIDPDELPGRADAEIDDYGDLRALMATFEDGMFGHRQPHRTEAPFALVLAGQVVRGRIDAVYREDDGSWLVVDWKTGREETADPLQLAIYRVAWADLAGVPVGRVRAAFYYVRSDRLSSRRLPDRAALEGAGQPRQRREWWVGSAGSAQARRARRSARSRPSRRTSAPVGGGRLLAGDEWSETVQMPVPCGRTWRPACRARSPPSRPRARRTSPSAEQLGPAA